MSMVEMLISISVIGIMSTIAIVNYKDIFGTSEDVICKKFTEDLNNALKEYQQSAWEVTLTANNNVTTEEVHILQSLQYQDITLFGSPYFRLDWVPSEGDDIDTYRIRWNGLTFELIEPGTTGKGLWFDPQGSQFGTTVSHEADFELAR